MSKEFKTTFLLIMLFALLGSNLFSGETDSEYNSEKALQLIGDIIFSAPSQTFQYSITTSLRSEISNSQIRYTTDGTIPTIDSTLYTSALNFSTTTQLRAQCFVNNEAVGNMGTAVYIACSANITHDLPLVIIDGYRGGKPDRDYVDMGFAFMELNGMRSSLLDKPSVITRGAYHLRGQSSASFDKAPYRIELRDNDDGDEKYDILGMGPDGDWAILGPFADKSLIRNAFAYELGASIGLDAPDHQLVEVYINQDDGIVTADDYEGVYLFVETIECSNDRIDIANLKKKDITEPEISGGYIMKFDMMAAEEPMVRGSGWSDLEVVDPDDLVPEQLTWISNYIQKVQDSIHSADPPNLINGYPAYIDVDSFVNYIILNELGKQGDSYVRSTYIYKDKEDKLKAGPLWDYNLAFDSFLGLGGWPGMPGPQIQNYEGWQYDSGLTGFGPATCDWFITLMQDPDFQYRIRERWWELRNGPLSDQEILNRINSLSNSLTNAADRNFQRWPNLQESRIGMFNTQVTQTWEEQIQILRDFMLNRTAWIDQNWNTNITTPTPGATPEPTPSVENLGDVNSDGTTDIVDALLIAQYYVRLDPDNFNELQADVDSNGFIDIVDALLISQLYVGIITSFPIG